MSEKIRAGRVHIFSLDLDDDTSEVSAATDQLLSEAELSRANKFIFPIHRQRYVRGRTWLRQILSDFSSAPADRIELLELEFGKPALKDSVLQFNLSHTENYAVLALSGSCRVGIDIESFQRELDVDGLRRTLYTDLENKWLDDFPVEQLRIGFFRLWTAKEARMKVTGEGFSLPPKDIEVQCSGRHASGYRKPVYPDVWLTDLPDMGANLCCTLATTKAVTEVIQHS